MSAAEEIIAAVKANDTARVRDLLEQDPALANTPTGDGSLLLTAVFRGAREIGDLIRARRHNLTVWEAACVGDVALLEAVLAADPALANVAQGPFLPLHLAAFFNQPEAARVLLERGAEIGALSQRTAFSPVNTALHAAMAGHAWAVGRLLIERGADVIVADSEGFTALHHAAFNGSREIVALLLDRGATVNPRDKQEETPLGKAIKRGNNAVADLLRQRGGEA